ncbi:hypothetical protein QYE76_014759 [Lolium multiflorum]|uniref:Retrotransposon gag domain-containing protein n=1 Tax=Lolium multiflorum TaxID=4521 RepID=A0AAD8U3K4_LOLMU|nr:hypothetical protein QYE76_014759 [Lolium multiflorum]
MSSAASSTPPASPPVPSSPSSGSPIRFGSFEYTPHSDSSRSTFSGLQENLGMTIRSVHCNINAEGVLRLLEPFAPKSARKPSPSAAGSIVSSSIDLSASLTDSTNSSPPSTPRSISSMSTGSDDSTTSDMTSYYCLNCDTRHGLGSSDTPFIYSARYSSGEESIDIAVRKTTWKTARHQVYATLNAGNAGNGGEEGDRTPAPPRTGRRCNFENSANNNSDYTIVEEEWVAARAAVFNNTPLPAGTSGNQIAVMQCLQLYLKDLARAWLRGLPKGSIKSWDDLVDAFVKNFQATYKRPVGIDELRHCQQKPRESMRTYIGRFTKLLNAAEDVSIDRAVDAFSDGIRRETYIEDLGRKKPKTITKLMEIANSWADGEDNVRRPRPCSDDEDDDQPRHDLGGRRDRRKKRKDRGYDDSNMVAAGYSDRRDDRYDDRRDDRRDNNRRNSGNRGNYKPRPPRTPELPFAEQINAPCYLHVYIDPKDDKKKSSHLLRDCRQFIEMQKLI